MSFDEHYTALVKQEISALKAYYGPSWRDLTPAQQAEKLDARLFRMLCLNAKVEAKSGNALGEHIYSLNLAARGLLTPK